MGGRFLNRCTITPIGSYKDWTPAQIYQWVRANGGQCESKVTSQTTHLVVHAKHWKNQTPMVREALELNAKKGRDIKIVTFDWMDDSMRQKNKKHEKPYSWEKLDPKSMKQAAFKAAAEVQEIDDDESNDDDGEVRGKPSKKSARSEGGPKSHVGMMAEVFHESTEGFLNEEEKRKLDKKIEIERRAQQELKAEELAAKQKAYEELARGASGFRKGAKKAKNEIFSEDHHIYTDETGFSYDVTLTKVDTRLNRNERWVLTLQIYEHNSQPHTYAMNAQFAGTGILPSNNILAAIGCNFATAFRQFRKAFKEKTGVDWDDRITHAAERTKRELRDRGFGTGSETGTQRGVAVSDSAAGSASEEDFANAPFFYRPPTYGAKGLLPESGAGRDEGVDAGQHESQSKERVEVWMSGANGAEPGESEVPAEAQFATGGDDKMQHTLDELISGANHGKASSNAIPAETSAAFDSFQFPFDNDELYLQNSMPMTDQDGYGEHTLQPDTAGVTAQQGVSFDPDAITSRAQQPTSFNTNAIMTESFEPGTQMVGETQMAERARGEFEEFLNAPGLDCAEEVYVGGIGDLLPSPAQPQQPMDLGSSVLGKRKSSPTQQQESSEQGSKKTRPDEGEDSFDEEEWLSMRMPPEMRNDDFA